ncbi:MAG: Grx4 family monothiol glutaredoxin [Polyangiaceae bacterium]
MQLDGAVKDQIESMIKNHRVMLFMKGSKNFPQCGFSATVVNILKDLDIEFETANVLADPRLRDGIKVFSDWPTIPQLYVDGQFVGGCDIVREMHASGELGKLVGGSSKPAEPPQIHITDAAAAAFQAATEPGEDELRIEIDPNTFGVDLYFGPKAANDITVVANGVKLVMDPATAKRAQGLRVDHVTGPDGQSGFKIENPNAPAQVKQIAARELANMLKGSEKVHLFDVRTEREVQIATIPGALVLDGPGREVIEKLEKDAVVVFYCHHGVRSLAAADHFLKKGFRRVYNLSGGIDAWSTQVDSSVARY